MKVNNVIEVGTEVRIQKWFGAYASDLVGKVGIVSRMRPDPENPNATLISVSFVGVRQSRLVNITQIEVND